MSINYVDRKRNISDGVAVGPLLKKVLINNGKNTCNYKIANKDENRTSRTRLPYLFFERPCVELAQSLIGKILARRLDSGEILRGKIVETESYLGTQDKASHSYAGKQTERNAPMFMSPGTAYVYFIYGMYFCFNISSFETGSAVLIRALEPLEGLNTMHSLRISRNSKPVSDRNLCNGPSKLCQAMMIDKQSINKQNLVTSSNIWVEDGPAIDSSFLVKCKRIGIKSSAEEWVLKPLRFYLKESLFVSIRDKKAEKYF